jgi:hypothetical protein
MITKEQIKKTLEMVNKLNGYLTLSYVPSSELTPEGYYKLYHYGFMKMEIYPEYYRDGLSLNQYKIYEDLVADFVI